MGSNLPFFRARRSECSIPGTPVRQPVRTSRTRNNFAPRFGFAYSPGNSGKTSIRGGFGVFYDILKAEDNLQFNGQVPFYGFADLLFDTPSKVTSAQNLLSDPFAAAGQPNPFPSRPPARNMNYANAGYLPIGGAAVYYVDPNLRTPYVYQFNLSVQRQLTHDLVLETSYVGSSSHKLTGLVDSNPLCPERRRGCLPARPAP